MGEQVLLLVFRNGSRLSCARAFLRPARDRPNLHIMINSTATKLLVEKINNSKRSAGIEFVYRNQSLSVKVKREIILSAGAVNSPHILLLSGIAPKHELDKFNISLVHHLPGVGRNLQNHVSFILQFKMKNRKAVNDLNKLSVHKFLNFRKGPMSSTGMAQVTARICTKRTKHSCPDLQLFFGGYLAGCSKFGCVEEMQTPSGSYAPRNFSITPVVLRPKSRGFIGLKSKNPLDAPLIQPNYLTEEDDVKTLITGIRIAQKLAGSKILKRKYGVEIIRETYGNCENFFR